MIRPMEFISGDRIGPYRIGRPLGRGGMGEVYETWDAEGNTRALKLFAADHGAVAFLQRRFLSEGRLLSKLSHPQLVHVYDVAVEEATERPFFVMDLVLDARGNPTTLEDVRKAGQVTEDLADRWYGDLCAALDYCHAQGVVHRDVKLNNVLLDAAGRAVLSDFGISRIFDPAVRNELQVTTTFVEGETTGTRPVMGTYWYLAPELRRGAEATAASDWYALGVTFFRLLTGLWYEPGTDALELLAPYGRRWRERLQRLLSDDPTKRKPVGRSPRDRREGRSRRIMAFLIGVLILASAACLFAWRTNRATVEALSAVNSQIALAFDATNRFSFCLCLAGTNGYRKITVAVTHPYWLATTPVTRRQWFAVRGEPLTAWEGGEDAPMTYVTRDEVTNFCARLNERFSAKVPVGYEIRLPTLAEWRLAYSTGLTVTNAVSTERHAQRRVFDAVGWYGQGVNGEAKFAGMKRYYAMHNLPVPLVKEIWPDYPPHFVGRKKGGWMSCSSVFAPVPVGLKPANALGLHDMCGNCFERTFDSASEEIFDYMLSEWGINTHEIYLGRGQAVTNPVERSGRYPLMVGSYMTPEIPGDKVWSSKFDRMPHLGFRLCLGPKLSPGTRHQALTTRH